MLKQGKLGVLGGWTAAIFMAGTALAEIPAHGVLHACYHIGTGGLRIIDSDTCGTCQSHEERIQWSISATAGAPGPTGSQGPPGWDGAMGPTGPQGLPGMAGPMGPDGLPGWDGAMGPTGPQGLPGMAGPMGPAGPPGWDGAMGPTGPQGQPGLQGLPGMAGPTGPAGSSDVLTTTTVELDPPVLLSTPQNVALLRRLSRGNYLLFASLQVNNGHEPTVVTCTLAGDTYQEKIQSNTINPNASIDTFSFHTVANLDGTVPFQCSASSMGGKGEATITAVRLSATKVGSLLLQP